MACLIFAFSKDNPRLDMKSIHQVREGQDVKVICNIDSNPKYSNVAWYMRSFEDPTYRLLNVNSTQSGLFLMDESHNQSILKINSVKRAHNNARFKCEVSNSILEKDTPAERKSVVTTQLSVLCALVLCLFKKLYHVNRDKYIFSKLGVLIKFCENFDCS